MSLVALVAALAAAFAAVGLADLAASRARRRPRRARRISGHPDTQAASALGDSGALQFVRRIGGALGAKAPRDLASRLEAAGLDAPVGEVMALKAGGALVALPAALPLAGALPGRLPLLAAVVAPLAAFLAPDLVVRARTRRRQTRMEHELADVLDLLRVAVGAGLSPGRALAEVGRRHPGILAAELRRMAARVALGVRHEEALDGLVRRCPVPAIRPLAAALARAARHGAPLAGALAAQALDARAEQARRTAEAAAKAAPKIQLVVALLLVPSVLLLVAAALLPAFLPAG